MSIDNDDEVMTTVQHRSFELPLEILLSGIISLTGGRSKEGLPFITCSESLDSSMIEELKEQEALDLFLHFSTIPSEVDKGLLVIVNGAALSQSLLTVLLQALAKFQLTFPSTLKEVLIVRPKEYDLELDTQKFQLTTKSCSFVDSQKLLQYVDATQLTPDLGGTLEYEHQEWVKYRLKVEPFMAECKGISKMLSGVIDELTSKMPTSAVEAEEALQLHQERCTEIMKMLHVDQLLSEGTRLLELMEVPHSSLKENLDYQNSIVRTKQLVHQIREIKAKIEFMWSVRCSKLANNFRFRKFEEDMQSIISWFREYEEQLLASADYEYAFKELMCDLDKAEDNSKYILEQLKILKQTSEDFLQSESYKPFWGNVRDLVGKVDQQKRQFDDCVRDMRERVKESIEFCGITQELLNWCIAANDVLDDQEYDRNSITREEVDGYLEEVDELTNSVNILNKDLKQMEESSDQHLPSWIKETTTMAFNREREMTERLSLRRQGLKGKRLNVPSVIHDEEIVEGSKQVASALQTVLITATGTDTALEASTASSEIEAASPRLLVTPSQEVDKALGELESAMRHLSHEHELEDYCASFGKESVDAGKSKPTIEMVSVEMKPQPIVDPAQQAKSEKMNQERRKVIKELIETEEKYVADLEHLINTYLLAYENGMTAASGEEGTGKVYTVPGPLIGKRQHLFCNIEQLLYFSKTEFLPELRKLEKSPMRLGIVFCQFEGALTQYALYFKNIPNQQALMKEGAVYFDKIQRDVGDKMLVVDQLSKPFDRMARYKLFIEKMSKNIPSTVKQQITENLKKAQKLIEFILRHGNDLLAVDNLTMAEGGVRGLGIIKCQGDLIHLEGRIKRSERRVFLFEEDLVVAKKSKAPKGSPMNEVFQEKFQLRLGDLSMREDLPEHHLRFELIHRKKEYIFQAPSVEEKQNWITELRSLFMLQVEKMKERMMALHPAKESIYDYTPRTNYLNRTRSMRNPKRQIRMSGNKRYSGELIFGRSPSAGFSDASSSPRASKISAADISKPMKSENIYEELPQGAVPAASMAEAPPPIPPRPIQPDERTDGPSDAEGNLEDFQYKQLVNDEDKSDNVGEN